MEYSPLQGNGTIQEKDNRLVKISITVVMKLPYHSGFGDCLVRRTLSLSCLYAF